MPAYVYFLASYETKEYIYQTIIICNYYLITKIGAFCWMHKCMVNLSIVVHTYFDFGDTQNWSRVHRVGYLSYIGRNVWKSIHYDDNSWATQLKIV